MIDEVMGIGGLLLAVSACVLTFVVIIVSLVKPKKMKSRKFYWRDQKE